MQEKMPFASGNNLGQDIPDGNVMQDGPGMLGVNQASQRGAHPGPNWEERNALERPTEFRTLSVSMDRLDLELNPPEDR